MASSSSPCHRGRGGDDHVQSGQSGSLTGSVIFHLLCTPWLRGCPFIRLPLHQLSCRWSLSSTSGFLLLLLHCWSSVVTRSFGQLNCFQLWFSYACGAAQYFPSSGPFTVSPLPLPFCGFLRLFLSWLPFSFSNSSLGNLSHFHFFTISRRVATKSKFLFLTTSFFFVSGILTFHPSSLSNVQLPTYSV